MIMIYAPEAAFRSATPEIRKAALCWTAWHQQLLKETLFGPDWLLKLEKGTPFELNGRARQASIKMIKK